MRQLSPASNLLLAAVVAVALVASLGLPWYAPPPPPAGPDVGAIEQAAIRVAHVFEHTPASVAGDAALDGARGVVLALAAAVMGLAAALAVPNLRPLLRDVLRAVAVVAPVLMAVLVVARPGGADGDLHWGALASFGISVLLSGAAWHGAGIRVRRPAPGAWAR